MQTDMPNGSSNPWTQAHKAAARQADKTAAAQEVVAQQGRIAASAAQRRPKADKPYIPAQPFFR